MFRQAKEKKLSEEVMQQVMFLISTKRIKYGDLLPSEEDLAKQIGVSRATVREGLRMLEFLGVVETKRGRGTIVIKTDDEVIQKKLKYAIERSKSIQELMQVREIIEPEVARLAAIEASKEDIENMERALSGMERDVSEGGMGKEDSLYFHYAMYRSINNSILTHIMTTVMDLQKESRNLTLSMPGRPKAALNEHKKVLEAIKQRNPEDAKKYMKEHANGTAKMINKYLKEER